MKHRLRIYARYSFFKVCILARDVKASELQGIADAYAMITATIPKLQGVLYYTVDNRDPGEFE